MYNTKFFKFITLAFIFLGIISPVLLAYLSWGAENAIPQDIIFKSLQIMAFSFTGYGVIFTVYTAVNQVEINKNDKKLELEFKKKNRAFEQVLLWDTAALLEARNYSREIKEKRSGISDQELISEINENAERASSVSILFNFAENIRILVRHDLADKCILSSVCYPLRDILNRFKAYYDHIHNSGRPSDKADAQRDFEETIRIMDECITLNNNQNKT
ncbi:TPA: DUF4760 domain-containing protein [Morganella morganii]